MCNDYNWRPGPAPTAFSLSVGIISPSTVLAVGANNHGELGVGDRVEGEETRVVEKLAKDGVYVVDIQLAAKHSLYLSGDGEVRGVAGVRVKREKKTENVFNSVGSHFSFSHFVFYHPDMGVWVLI